jgi:hypothetical protein
MNQMAWAGNNQAIFNAAMNGMASGILAGRKSTDGVATDYAALYAAAAVFATGVDTAIATDATMSTGASGTTVVGSAGANQNSFNRQPDLVFGLAFGYFFGSALQGTAADTTAATYTTAVAVILAAYTASTTQATASFSKG